MFRIIRVEDGFFAEVYKEKKGKWYAVDDDGDTHKRYKDKMQWALLDTVEEAVTILKTFYQPDIVVQWDKREDIGYTVIMERGTKENGRPDIKFKDIEYEYTEDESVEEADEFIMKRLPKYGNKRYTESRGAG